MWKDGTLRDVVLIPSTAADEMECSWELNSGYTHSKMLDDGMVSMSPQQQHSLFKDLLSTKGASQLVGMTRPASTVAQLIVSSRQLQQLQQQPQQPQQQQQQLRHLHQHQRRRQQQRQHQRQQLQQLQQPHHQAKQREDRRQR